MKTFSIFQMKRVPSTRYMRFESYNDAVEMNGGKLLTEDLYDLVYTAPIENVESADVMLNEIFVKFNIARPQDFKGHSLSMSDVIALDIDGTVSYYYVDSIGFKKMDAFEGGAGRD